MTNLWYPQAVVFNGPTHKTGYPTLGNNSPKWGEIKHSAEGNLDGAHNVLMNPSIDSSWHFTICYDHVEQHYPMSMNTWHGNDTDWDNGVRANIDLVGVEHLGVAGEPLTEYQIQATTDLTRWMAEEWGYKNKYSRLLPPISGMWLLAEHNELGNTPTACPSNRIPWVEILERLTMPEVTYTPEQMKDALIALAHFIRNGYNLSDLSETDKAAARAAVALIP